MKLGKVYRLRQLFQPMPDAESSSHAETPRRRTSGTRDTRFDPPHEVARGDSAQAPAGVSKSLEAPVSIKREPAFAGIDASGSSIELPSPVQDVSGRIGDLPSAETDAIPLPPELMQQFRSQAQQLAGYLDDRQRELDRREAQLNAQLAKQESATRNARLWLQEREAEFAARETELAQCEAELTERKREIQSREVAIESRERELARNASITDAPPEPVTHAAPQIIPEIEIEPEELRPLPESLRRQQIDLDEIASQLSRREESCAMFEHKLEDMLKRLAASDAALTRGQLELEEDRRRLEAEREALLVELNAAKERLATERRRDEEEQAARNQTLSERQQQLELRAAAVEQMRAEILQAQRESLETRLATEELCAQLYGDAPPAGLMQSVAQLRAKIAEDFQLQSKDLASQRLDAQRLMDQMVQQHQRLIEQKQEFAENSLRQQREIETQAARLCQRETQLRRQQEQLERLQFRWQSERRNLECELARLQAELARRILAGADAV